MKTAQREHLLRLHATGLTDRGISNTLKVKIEDVRKVIREASDDALLRANVDALLNVELEYKRNLRVILARMLKSDSADAAQKFSAAANSIETAMAKAIKRREALEAKLATMKPPKKLTFKPEIVKSTFLRGSPIASPSTHSISRSWTTNLASSQSVQGADSGRPIPQASSS